MRIGLVLAACTPRVEHMELAHWTADDGCRLSEVELVGDIDRDGLSDALVVYWCRSERRASAFVSGPLDQDLTLPRDARWTIDDAVFRGLGDFDGDGAVELLLDREAWGRAPVLVGPEGPTVLARDRSEWHDLDGNGRFERIDTVISKNLVHIWWDLLGTESAGPADYQIDLSATCPSNIEENEPLSALSVWPDFDHDGRDELVLDTHCDQRILMNLARSYETIEFTPSDPADLGPAVVPIWVGDQLGDGWAEFLVWSRRVGLGLYRTPARWAPGGGLGSEPWRVMVPPGVPLGELRPTRLDVDGNERPDVLHVDSGQEPQRVSLWPGGLDGLHPRAAPSWEVSLDHTVGPVGMIDDVPVLVLEQPRSITVVDLRAPAR